MPEPQRPVMLFYCQHSLGIGHLTRSFALVQALAAQFQVVFLNGGPLPPGVPLPAGMQRIDLPPLGMDDGHTLVSRSASHSVAEARRQRLALLLEAVARHRPALLLVELFPFGRKKFAGEIIPLLRAARAQGARVACSLRDILVDARPDQQRHDDRARWMADRWFHAVLVHSDERFAQLAQSFRPRRPLAVPVFHTGYVVPARAQAAGVVREAHLLVSAGGGIVGEPLFQAVLAAHALLPAPQRAALPLRIVAGPFLPEPAWQRLQQQAAARPGVTLLRQVPDMVLELRRARASLSQCGYNTALDLAVAGVPALVLPYQTATENEQTVRAQRLAGLGALQWLDPQALTPQALARALPDLLAFQPRRAALALDGAQRSAALLADLVHEPVHSTQEAACATC